MLWYGLAFPIIIISPNQPVYPVAKGLPNCDRVLAGQY